MITITEERAIVSAGVSNFHRETGVVCGNCKYFRPENEVEINGLKYITGSCMGRYAADWQYCFRFIWKDENERTN